MEDQFKVIGIPVWNLTYFLTEYERGDMVPASAEISNYEILSNALGHFFVYKIKEQTIVEALCKDGNLRNLIVAKFELDSSSAILLGLLLENIWNASFPVFNIHGKIDYSDGTELLQEYISEPDDCKKKLAMFAIGAEIKYVDVSQEIFGISSVLLLIAFVAKTFEKSRAIGTSIYRFFRADEWINTLVSINQLRDWKYCNLNGCTLNAKELVYYLNGINEYFDETKSNDRWFVTAGFVVAPVGLLDKNDKRKKHEKDINQTMYYLQDKGDHYRLPGIINRKLSFLELDQQSSLKRFIRKKKFIWPIIFESIAFWATILLSVSITVISIYEDYFNEQDVWAKRICEPLAIMIGVDFIVLNFYKLLKGSDTAIRQAMLCYREIRFSEDLISILNHTSELEPKLKGIDVATIRPDLFHKTNLCFIDEYYTNGHIISTKALPSTKNHEWAASFDVTEADISYSENKAAHTIVLPYVNTGFEGDNRLKIWKVTDKKRNVDVERLNSSEYWVARLQKCTKYFTIGGFH